MVGGEGNKFADTDGNLTDDIDQMKIFSNVDDAILFASDFDIPTIKGFRLDVVSIINVKEALGETTPKNQSVAKPPVELPEPTTVKPKKR